jgi:hypothetical protein
MSDVGDIPWSGPAWAAPEWSDRVPSHVDKTKRGRADFPIRALALGYIRVEDYRLMREAEQEMARANRARGVPRL